MSAPGPDFATRTQAATDRAMALIERMSAHNWTFDATALQQTTTEAEQAFIIDLITQGRTSIEELRAFVAEYRATRLEEAFQAKCTQTKTIKLARLG